MAKRDITKTVDKAFATDEAARIAATVNDSFTNFAQKMGVGADNPLSTSSYGFNPVTRVRTLLEWIHRGSWVGGVAVDVIADDMTREGVDLEGELDPDDISRLHREANRLNIWAQVRDTVAWSRLYGGCLAVMLIDGQDSSTPLRLDTIGKGDFKGLLVLDRWMVEPSMGDLVTEYGPHLGLPKYYKVTADAPALPRMKIHYTRCIRLEGVRLPYWQRVMENLWGISIYERIYDRMQAFDSATTGAAQLVYKAYIRTYKIKDMKEVVAAGGPALDGLVKYTEMMRRFQGMEGITLMDADDEFEGHSHTAFSGLSDALTQFGQQLSGALQIPLVRLFGQSPAGFSTGETDLRNYYDNVKTQQERELGVPLVTVFRALAASCDIKLPDDFGVTFRSLWQLSDTEKSTIAQTTSGSILAAESAGVIDRVTALKELKQSSRVTGVFTNITKEMIEEAEDEGVPSSESLIIDPPVTPPPNNTPPAAPTPTKAMDSSHSDSKFEKMLESMNKMTHDASIRASLTINDLMAVVKSFASRPAPAPAAPQPINVAAPVVNMPPPVFNIKQGDTAVHLPEGCIKVNNQVSTPEVKFTAGDVHVGAPEIKIPDIIVNVPKQPPPVIEVTVQPAEVQLHTPARKSESTVQRDMSGNILKTTTIEKDIEE
jgi:hypothetical protein